MSRDILTYRYPRTTGEAFGCDATSAHAIERTRKPLAARITDAISAVVMGLIFCGFALAYFDVLIK